MHGLAEPSPDELRIPETIEPRLQPPPETHREVAQLLERCQVDLQKAVVGIPAAHVASLARRRGCRSGVKSALNWLARWRANSQQCRRNCELAHPTRFERVTFAFGELK